MNTLKVIRGKKRRKPPLAIHHPLFRKGYQDGRQAYFRKNPILTDQMLVEWLWKIVQDAQQGNALERKENAYYGIGFILGQMSASVMPQLPHEEKEQEAQEAFLLNIKEKYQETDSQTYGIIGMNEDERS